MLQYIFLLDMVKDVLVSFWRYDDFLWIDVRIIVVSIDEVAKRSIDCMTVNALVVSERRISVLSGKELIDNLSCDGFDAVDLQLIGQRNHKLDDALADLRVSQQCLYEISIKLVLLLVVDEFDVAALIGKRIFAYLRHEA